MHYCLWCVPFWVKVLQKKRNNQVVVVFDILLVNHRDSTPPVLRVTMVDLISHLCICVGCDARFAVGHNHRYVRWISSSEIVGMCISIGTGAGRDTRVSGRVDPSLCGIYVAQDHA